MICIFFISGSKFQKSIPLNPNWTNWLQKQPYSFYNCLVLDFPQLIGEYRAFYKKCQKKYNNVKIGVLGLSSGGYYAIRLSNMIKSDFCITVCPIVDPIFRRNFLLQKNIVIPTPKVRKIQKIKTNKKLMIVGKNDEDAPLEMYSYLDDYQVVDKGHEIVSQMDILVSRLITKFLKKV